MKKEEIVETAKAENSIDASLEELLLQSDLLAGMVRADGKILDVENTVASTYFEQKNHEKSDLVKSHFEYVTQDETTDSRLDTVMSFMTKLNKEDKYKLLRCLSAVAICDGHLDEKEVTLINKFADAMDIDPSGV